MEAATKAKELVEKFKPHTGGGHDISHKNAKACALICVDEILMALNESFGDDRTTSDQYWQTVKQEINKM